jgi:hypothetical protein
MTGKDVCLNVLQTTQFLLKEYFKDLSDADLQKPPVTGANNMAWQTGHLIASETQLGAILGAQYPELPPALKELGSGKSATTQPNGGGLSKGDYLAWFDRVRKATIAAVEKMSDADLDKPTSGPMKDFAPTCGAVIVLLGNHTMMHAGQFTCVRRALGKPILF